MATSNIRSTRKLRNWIIEQVNSGKFPGLIWDDVNQTSFRIPWKHAGKHDFRPDEDAAFFKEWAIFKNKYKDGAKIEAAMWKTRLRCALNKSPEFAEVPERSQLDISEPYKVYRLVPAGEQIGKQVTSSRKRTLKEEDRNVSSEDEMEHKKRSKFTLITKEVKDEPSASTTFYTEDSGIGSSSDSPRRISDSPQRYSGSPYGSCDSLQRSSESPDYSHEIRLDLREVEALETPAVLSAGNNVMRVTIYYSGQQMLQKDIQTYDCRISSSPPTMGRTCVGMEQISLPPADAITDSEKRHNTQNLLTFLDKGIMLASNQQGIYVQRSCRGRVFWTGPCSRQPGGSNLLNKGEHVKLFDAIKFRKELELYQNRQGMPPMFQVTLCFGEEITENDQKENKLIIVQVEQKLAQEQVLQDVPESLTNTILFNEAVCNQLVYETEDELTMLRVL